MRPEKRGELRLATSATHAWDGPDEQPGERVQRMPHKGRRDKNRLLMVTIISRCRANSARPRDFPAYDLSNIIRRDF
jgi:hypothetical protein